MALTQALHPLVALWHTLTEHLIDSYHPERHYMRGPGPKWHAKHEGAAAPTTGVGFDGLSAT